MEKTPYQRKLAHPDWQKKRLEVMERDNFRCQNNLCLATDKELHIHHIYYLPNTNPQDYPMDAYITMCHECHEKEELLLKELSTNFVMRLRVLGADAWQIAFLLDNIEESHKRGLSVFHQAEILSNYSCGNKLERGVIWDIFKMIINRRMTEFQISGKILEWNDNPNNQR